MLTVETIARVRREHAKGKSIRAIARDLRLSRDTVTKYLRSDETEARYEREAQPFPQLGPFLTELDGLLERNGRQQLRDRMDKRQLFETLRRAGYAGGYDAVRRYAKRWAEAQATTAAKATEAFIPLTFAPGEAYQFDWSEEWIVLDGVAFKAQVAQVRLCHSRMPYIRAYPRQTQEMVFDAHARAFAFWGGTCERGIYDNMKTAVDAVFVGKERKFNRRFAQMCSHYLVEPTACTPAAGWEEAKLGAERPTARSRTRSAVCVSACSSPVRTSRRWTSLTASLRTLASPTPARAVIPTTASAPYGKRSRPSARCWCRSAAHSTASAK
jgi:transposase